MKQLLFNIWILFIHLIKFGISNDAEKISSEQHQFINYYANIYARLTYTFDPAEVPLEQYYNNNLKELQDYATIMKEIRREIDVAPGLSNFDEAKRFKIFFKEVDQIVQNEFKNNKHFQKPWTFKFFKAWYTLKRVSDSHFKIPENHPDKNAFCKELKISKQISEIQLKEALNTVKISYPSIVDIRKGRDDYLPNEFLKIGEQKPANVNNWPEKFSTHHIIPASRLKDFFDIYFTNRQLLSDELHEKGFFDWYMIEEHNKRKLMIITYRDLFLQQTDPSTPGFTQLERDKEFKQFINRLHTTPIGLAFRGPSARSDDPNKKFEEKCEIIVGSAYFAKLKQLDEDIKNYIEKCEPKQRKGKKYIPLTPLEKVNIGDHLYNHMMSIYIEGGQILFHYNPNYWIFNTLQNNWEIGVNPNNWRFNNGEWLIKNFIQEDAFAGLLDGLNIDDRYSYTRNEFRKKRNNSPFLNYSISDYEDIYNEKLCMEIPTTTTIKSNGFWCSSFYLRINPMQYFYCKLTGHQNLHFF